MTKNLRALLKAQLITTWRGIRDNMGGGKSKWGLLLIPLLALAFVPLLAMVAAAFVGIYMSGKILGYPEIVLVLGFTAGQLVCLTFGVFYVISAFYFAKDINMLIPMPIRPGEIVLSKFIGIMVGEYLTMVPVVLPAVVIYGIFSDVAWTYLPFALLIFVLLPVAPLVISALFSIVLMRVTNLRRNKDIWRVLGGLIGLAIGLGINYFTRMGARKGAFNPESQQMGEMVSQVRQVLEGVGKYVPMSIWAKDALKEGAPALGIGPFLLFVAVAVVALALMVWVAEKLFYGGAVGGEERRASGKKLSRDELAKETAQSRSPLWALYLREFKLLNRTPSFLMQALVPLIILPFFVLMPMLQEKELGNLLRTAAAHADSPLVPVIGVGIVLFMASISSIAATAVSREGKYFWISRSLPVPPHTQVHAKLLHSMSFSVLNILVVLGVLGYFRFLTMGNFLYILVGGVAATAAMGYASLLVDIIRPNLKWTDPQQAMKGNYNVLFGMLFIWVTMAFVALVTWLVYTYAPSFLMPAILLFFCLMAYGMGKGAGALADKRYLEIED